ncbi:peptide chain release factor 2 [Pyruvatibacter sp. HU-CL02332]|uniref:peptide chain release factor 2 n=1 Tax=Pyruvatibacter sp. HU-CL02332 TaxID=3127650 RepID=UPI00336586B2
MRAEIRDLVDELQQSLALLRRHFDPVETERELEKLNERAEDSSLWDDPEKAQAVMRDRTRLETALKNYRDLESALSDNVELIEMGEAEGDEEVVAEAEASLRAARDLAAERELETLLSGEADSNDTYLEVHAGAGGTESNDWAQMLLRMYMRWGEAKGYKVDLVAETQGEEAGIKSATLQIKGHNAYGWLRTESGVHRLVRISPYDSQARRHTSFASVWVYPIVDDSIEIDIPESDVRIDTYRASGAGGQHVNTTDSAVRITHNPTGIVVQCQNERSQHKNKATAWTMLRARIYEAELQRREEEAQEQAASKTDIGWGHQIRSYVLQPYQLVKDLRTGVEIGNPSAVLDGGIDPFLAAALANKVEDKEQATAEVAE